jgi:hypothetical protein
MSISDIMIVMPDKRRHRGRHPQDEGLFAADKEASLRAAVGDLSWLLSRGYAGLSSLKLVGDRYDLTVRQRVAVARSACSDEGLAGRLRRRMDVRSLGGRELAIDGYNLLITIEAALAGGVILAGRDSTFRDLASVHGSYRSMAETTPALELIGQSLQALGVRAARWMLDSPVSNSGRLRQRMLDLAGEHGWAWSVELVQNPDKDLMACDLPVVTSDSVVLDGCAAWANLARHIIETQVPRAWVADMAGE